MTSQENNSHSWLHQTDRILVTGCGGWFGRTLTSMLGGHPQLLLIGSPRDPSAIQWDNDMIQRFAPTVVANFAFNTRDRLAEMGRERYLTENAELTRRLIFALKQDSVRIGLTVSSGAAVAANSNSSQDTSELYGKLKAHEETKVMEMASKHRSVVVARAYSVSGPFVRRTHDYAFSGLIAQAIAGDMTIEATQPVYRRYVSISDLLTVSFTLAGNGWSGIIDSGGDLIEMQDLAEIIRGVVNPTARINRGAIETWEPSVYASDNVTWSEGCRRTQIEPLSLPEQVFAVESYLRSQHKRS